MMNHNDACSILGLTESHITPADVKLAYRRAAATYHPDHNPAGLEMMKLVNLAYEALKDFEGEIKAKAQNKANYGEAVNTALNAIIDLGLDIEVCGTWVWVSGDTKPHKDTLKSAGFMWAPKKAMWYFRPSEHKSFNRSPWSMGDIRATHGSSQVDKQERALLH